MISQRDLGGTIKMALIDEEVEEKLWVAIRKTQKKKETYVGTDLYYRYWATETQNF